MVQQLVQTNKHKNKIGTQKLEQAMKAKTYLEQKLVGQGCTEHVKYDASTKSLILFKIKDGVIAVLKTGRIITFKMPIKKWNGKYPKDSPSVKMSSIKKRRATYCRKCDDWKNIVEGIAYCSCGRNLRTRTRFTEKPVESWSQQHIEVGLAMRDVESTQSMEYILSKRVTPKVYHNVGMTRIMGGMSSVEPEVKPYNETLLIPTGDEIKQVTIKHEETLSLMFAAKITVNGKVCDEAEQTKMIRQYIDETESISVENDKVFAAETKQFMHKIAPEEARQMVNSWNREVVVKSRNKVSNPNRRDAKAYKTMSGRKYSRKATNKQTFFASSMPVSTIRNSIDGTKQ